MSTRACVLASRLALALCAAGPAAHAAEPLLLKLATSLTPPRPAYEEMIVEVSVNGQRRGEFTVYRLESDFYLKGADLAALGLAGRAAGSDPVPLRSLAPRRLAFDEARLALEIEFAPAALKTSAYDVSFNRPNPPQELRGPGAFLNYRASVSDGSGFEPRRLGLANELAVRAGDVLLRNEAAIVHAEGSTRSVRYATQLVHDRPADQLRLVAGDHTAASGELGSTLALGGISLSKLYTLTPHFIRQPLAGYAGAVSTPSQVEVRMGGIPVFREQVPAGPFELRNLQQFAGARDVEIRVRDAMGRESLTAFPYYFADQALRAGLHEYSYSLGALREEIGVRNNEYGAGVASGQHRYGLTDQFTVGGRGEAARGLWNLGPTALYRNDRLGVFSAGLAASGRDGRSGHAGAFGYGYQGPRFGLHANARRYSEHYAVAQDLVAPTNLAADTLVGGSVLVPGAGTFFLDRTITKRRFSGLTVENAATTLSYSQPLSRQASFFATLTRVDEPLTDTRAFLSLMLTLDRVKTAHLSAHQNSSRSDAMLGAQLSSAVPAGEGLGYRFGYDGILSSETSDLHGFAQYNARAASFSLEGVAARNSGQGESRYEAAVAGAATWAGGRFGLTRQIDDSFVAVQLAAPLEGVRVYSNNQEVGRTDREGRLLVPNVGSYYETQIAIDEADVPLDHAIGSLRRVVAPPYRSGSLLYFNVRRQRAVEGVLPVENALFSIGGQQSMTGRGGRFYIEDLPPGRHEGRLGNCRFFIDVPDAAEPVVTLPEVACE